MRVLIASVTVLMLSGCASSHRIEPLVSVRDQGPLHFVVKEHDGLLNGTIGTSGGAVAVLGPIGGFAGGFVGSLIDTAIDASRMKRAHVAIAPLRELWSGHELNALVSSELRQIESPHQGAPILDVVMMPRPLLAQKFPEEDDYMAEDGLTIFIEHNFAMAPAANSFRAQFTVTGYLSASGRRVYQSIFACESSLANSLTLESNVATWAFDDGALLKAKFESCVRALSDLVVVDLFEIRSFDMDSIAARKVARAGYGDIPRGRFGEFNIYEIRNAGYVLRNVVRDYPALVLLDGSWAALDRELIVAQLRSHASSDWETIARAMINHQVFQEDLLDLAATVAWKNRNAAGDETLDAVSWLATLLGESGNSRYREFLRQLAKMAPDYKIKKYALDSLAELEEDEVEQFVVNKKILGSGLAR